MKSKALIRSVSLILILSMLSGCATTEDGRLAQAQGTGIGAVGGALLGGLLTAATGGSRDQIMQNATIGAVAGGVAGYAYGSAVAQKKAQYQSTEEWLDACIAAAQQRNQQAYAYNNKLKNRVSELEQKVQDAKSRGDTKALSSLKGQITSAINDASKQKELFQADLQNFESVPGQTETGHATRLSEVKSSVSNLRGNINTTESSIQRLASLRNSIDV